MNIKNCTLFKKCFSPLNIAEHHSKANSEILRYDFHLSSQSCSKAVHTYDQMSATRYSTHPKRTRRVTNAIFNIFIARALKHKIKHEGRVE